MNIAFYIDEMNFRGIANSIYQYSYYNEKILIFFNLQDKTIELNVPLPFKSNLVISDSHLI